MNRRWRDLATKGSTSPAVGALVGALDRAERRWARDRAGVGRLPILTYHRIAEAGSTPTLMESVRSTDPHGFIAQIDLLARTRRFLSIDELLELRRTGAPPPPDAVMLTFDDSYRDLEQHAWPALRAREIPATLFVATGFIDTDAPYWWDALHHAVTGTAETSLPWRARTLTLGTETERRTLVRALRDEVKRLPHDDAMASVDALVVASGVAVDPAPTLGWDDLRRLHAEGLALAPHSRSHAFLDQVPPTRARAEVEGSMADLEREIGVCPPVFAYPSGQWDAGSRQAVADAGIEVALTTNRGVNRLPGADWLTLDRINVGGATTPAMLRAQLLRSAGPLLR